MSSRGGRLFHLRSVWREYPHHTALGLIALTAVVRFAFVASGQLDLVQDEAQYWTWSRNLHMSYYSKGPLIAWMIAGFTSIFGDTECGVRFGAVLGSSLAQIVLYLGLGVLMQRARLAVIALFVLNTTPLFMVGGVLMTTDNPLLLCWLAALFCLHAAAVRPERAWPWLVFALSMAVGLLAKYTMLIVAVIAVLHAFGLYRLGLLPKGHVRRLACALVVGVVTGLLPIVAWNAQNDWVSFRHVGRLAGMAPAAGKAVAFVTLKYVPEYLGGQLGLVYPWWLAFMLCGGVAAVKRGWLFSRRFFPAKGEALPLSPDARDIARADVLFSAGFWPIFLFFFIWSFHTRIYANWPAMCYVAGIVLAARAMDALLEAYRGRAGQAPWTRTLLPLWVGLSFVLCVAIHAQEPVSRILPAAYNPAMRLKGWEDLGRRLGEIRDAMPNPEKVFFFSDAYDVTSELAFYVPGKPVTFCADFGRRLNQFDFWPDPEGREGWDAVFVRRAPFTSVPPLLRTMFATIGEPEAYASTHRGAPGRTFGIVVVRHFNGIWPRVSKGIY